MDGDTDGGMNGSGMVRVVAVRGCVLLASVCVCVMCAICVCVCAAMRGCFMRAAMCYVSVCVCLSVCVLCYAMCVLLCCYATHFSWRCSPNLAAP